MKCPCGHGTVVKDGRYTEHGYWRRRCCLHCGKETTTLEQVCETHKGQHGGARSVARVIAPAVPVITVEKKRQAAQRPIIPKQATAPVQKQAAAWARIADMKEQKALEKL